MRNTRRLRTFAASPARLFSTPSVPLQSTGRCLAMLALLTVGWIGYAAPPQPGKSNPPQNPKSKFQNPAPPVPNAQPLTPSLPPPTELRRLALVSPLPAAMQAQAVHVDIDTLAVVGSLPVMWRGSAHSVSADASAASLAASEGTALRLQRLRRASNAALARIQPFTSPDAITINAEGLPVVAWESADAVLKRAGQEGEEVIFDLPAPEKLSPAAWKAFGEAVLRRYRVQPHVAVARWEVACGDREAPARYEAFARQARALTPNIPVGLNIVTGDAAEGIRRTAQRCVQNKIQLDSTAWQLAEGSAGIGQVQRIRQALAAFPTLKATLLLPTLTPPHAEASLVAPLASTCARLMQTVSPLPPNPFVGALVQTQPDAGPDRDDPTQPDPQVSATQTLTLLNRLAGTRLRASSDDTGVGCLAARSQSRTLALLWREPAAARSLLTPSRVADASNALVLVRLRHLPLTDTLRVTRYEPDHAATETGLETVQAGKAKPDEISVLPPVLTADVLPGGNFLPGEVEFPVLLEPGGVCLLEITPGKPPSAPIELTLATLTAGVHGGDTLDIVLTARNVGAKPQKLEAALTSTLPDMLPQKTMRLQLGMLAVHQARAFRLVLRAPVLGAATNATLTARVNTDNATALTIPIASPLTVGLETLRTDLEAGTGHANVRVRMSNPGHAKLNVQLTAKDAGGTNVTLAPDGKPVSIAVALTPPSREPGVYPLPLRVKNQDTLLLVLYPLLGVPYVTPYTAIAPTIDGDLNEWTGSETMGMGRAEQAHGKAWGGPSDISAYAHARWDEQFLYFACAVTDDVFTPSTSAARMEQGDCVLFALATNTNGKPHAAGDSMGYAKFGMALIQGGAGEVKPALVRFPAGQAAAGAGLKTGPEPVKNARIAIRQEGARTYYEAAIPWSALRPGLAFPGMGLALSILVNDVDGTAHGYMTWSSGLVGTPNPALFIPLRLIK